MESKTAVVQLTALGHDTRMAIFLRLIQVGDQGMAPGQLGAQLGIPPATLSFHLKELNHAGLLNVRQEGRFLYYSPHAAAMDQLVSYLRQNCCRPA